MGTTKRTYHTNKEVADFLNRTETKAKENARRAVEDYVTATNQVDQSYLLHQNSSQFTSVNNISQDYSQILGAHHFLDDSTRFRSRRNSIGKIS